MESYIPKDYFQKLELLFSSEADKFVTGQATGIISLFQLFNALPINTDLDDTEIKKCAIALIGNKKYSSWKEIIIFNAIKNQSLKKCNIKELATGFKNHSAFYFFDHPNTSETESSNGVVCKGNDYNGDSFYEDCNKKNLSIKDWGPIKAALPPTNAMLIVDKYIFGNPFEKKLKRLKEFIELYKGDLRIPFHLTILFSLEEGNRGQGNPTQIQKAFDTLSELKNMEVQIFADNNEHDRLIFTNYTSVSVGNFLSEKKTVFNQNFMGWGIKRDNIIANYRDYKEELLKCHTIISKIPPKIGLLQTTWETSKFTNRIFTPYLENNN